MCNIAIHEVSLADAYEIIAYVIRCRKILFPMLDHQRLPKDLALFEETYLNSQMGNFLEARTSTGKLAGAIGMMPYDYRFAHLEIDNEPTVEVARLFVEPEFRRTGLGTLLFQVLKQTAIQKKIKRLYLHTHPFLEGAYAFWLKNGFTLIDFREESGFQTLHMELNLNQHNKQKVQKELRSIS